MMPWLMCFFIGRWFELQGISILNGLLLCGMPSAYPHISTDTLKMARVQMHALRSLNDIKEL